MSSLCGLGTRGYSLKRWFRRNWTQNPVMRCWSRIRKAAFWVVACGRRARPYGCACSSPKKIARANRISPSYLYSLFADNNTTVSQFIQARRLQKAYEMLVADANGALTVSEIAYQVGFKNASHFSRTFSRHFRIAPCDARQSGLAGRIREAAV